MKRLIAGVVLAGLLPMALVACGDDSDPDDATDPTGTSGEVTATATTTESGTSESGTTESGTAVAGVGASDAEYEAYVSEVCQAAATFRSNLSAQADTIRNNPAQAFEAAEGPFRDLADDLEGIEPPEDLADWHGEARDRIGEVADGLGEGDVGTLARVFNDNFPPVPDGAREKLQEAARGNEDCQRASLFS